MPFTPEVAIAMLACGKIGAIFIPIFSGYAAPAVASRLNDWRREGPDHTDGFTRRGKPIAMKEVADASRRRLAQRREGDRPRRIGSEVPWNSARDVWWDDLVDGQPTSAKAVIQTPNNST